MSVFIVDSQSPKIGKKMVASQDLEIILWNYCLYIEKA